MYYNAGRRADRAIAVTSSSRKVRTPQGRIAANGRPARCASIKPRTRATETSLRGGHSQECTGTATPCRDSWKRLPASQGETRQPLSGATSNRHAHGLRAWKSGSLEYAGRWLERSSNGSPRGMIARQGSLAYRIRPIDLLCFLFIASRPAFEPAAALCRPDLSARPSEKPLVCDHFLIKDFEFAAQHADLSGCFLCSLIYKLL